MIYLLESAIDIMVFLIRWFSHYKSSWGLNGSQRKGPALDETSLKELLEALFQETFTNTKDIPFKRTKGLQHTLPSAVKECKRMLENGSWKVHLCYM